MTAVADRLDKPRLYAREGDGLYIDPHWGQRLILEATERFIIAICGTQSGKTAIMPAWTHQEIGRFPACDTEGDGDHIVASATYDLLEAKLIPAYRDYYERGDNSIRWGTWSASRKMLISREDKSRIVFRSAETPESLETFTARSAVCDEFGQARVPVASWEAILRRLSTSQGRALLGTTPYTMGWLRAGPVARAKGGDPDYVLINFPSDANPQFNKAEMERARLTLPDWKFQMFYMGNFSRPAGLIYGDYDDFYAYQERDEEGRWLVADMSITEGGPYGHLCRAFQIPPTWLRSVGVDFGGTEHTALTWWAEQPGTGIWFGYREAIGGGLSGAEHARAALEYQEPVKMWVGGAGSENDARESWARANVPVIEPFFPGVEEGIDRLVALLRERRVCIFDTMTGLRGELGTYSRELDASGEPTMKIQDKARFHICDSARYWASTVPFNRPRPPREAPSTEGRTLAAIREHAKLLGVKAWRRM